MKPNQPIIIKKIKKGGHGHHGGAWKVAYADFVTAMMAFFLLLWLLSATPAENLKGLADYFSPTMGLKDRLGIGFRGGTGTTDEGVSNADSASQGLVFGAPPSGSDLKLPDGSYASGDGGDEQYANQFSLLQSDIMRAIEASSDLADLRDSIMIQQVPEGLKIEVSDLERRPMFQPGKAELFPYMSEILGIIAKRIRYLPHHISITGHTNSIRNSGLSGGYTNWELSADRANASRRVMVEAGMDPEQVAKIQGFADTDPVDRDDPNNAKNRRITIIILKNSMMPIHRQVVPSDVLGTSDAEKNMPQSSFPTSGEMNAGLAKAIAEGKSGTN